MLAIEPMNALVVHGMAFSDPRHMKAPVSIPRPLCVELPLDRERDRLRRRQT
jgi:hypothetical protein